jgi:peptidoglycan/xylan/chitin deacetylase (PgdA/CDA1 family)
MTKLRHSIPVLLYHHVNTKTRAFTTAPDLFREHLAWLAAQGYRSLTTGEFEEAVRTGEVGPKRFLLTFDDASADLPYCADVMLAFGFTGIAFLVTRSVGHDPRCVGWRDVSALSKLGVLDFQSHSHEHLRWPLSGCGERFIEEDLKTSREVLAERLGTPMASIRHLAWPWGRCSAAFEKQARDLGFTWQYLLQNGGVNRVGGQLRLPRVCADGVPLARFRLALSLLANSWSVSALNAASGMVRRARHGIGY